MNLRYRGWGLNQFIRGKEKGEEEVTREDVREGTTV